MLHDQVVTPLASGTWERRKSRGASPSSQRSASSSASSGVGKDLAKTSDLQATAIAWRKGSSSNSGNGKPKVKAKTDAGDSLVVSNNAGRRKPSPSASPVHLPVWLTEATDCNDVSIPIADRLGREMMTYCAYTQRVIESVQRAIDEAIKHISVCVHSIWPEASVACYGSYASGLWLPSSDVDVVVMGLTNDQDPDVKTQFVLGARELEMIAARLREQSWIQQIEVVGSAKVPVAKVVLAENGLRVDISIENVHTRLGIEASDLAREYVQSIPLLRPMLLVVKQFLREKGLNNAFTGGVSSYAVALMAVFLIKQQELTDATEPEVLGQLLLDFFEYYGMGFSFATTGISLKENAFGEYLLTPHIVMSSTGVPMLMPQLVIDDPVYINGQHNVGAGAFAIARVIAALEDAFHAVSFHRPTKFTPTPLCQLLHWSGHGTAPSS